MYVRMYVCMYICVCVCVCVRACVGTYVYVIFKNQTISIISLSAVLSIILEFQFDFFDVHWVMKPVGRA